MPIFRSATMFVKPANKSNRKILNKNARFFIFIAILFPDCFFPCLSIHENSLLFRSRQNFHETCARSRIFLEWKRKVKLPFLLIFLIFHISRNNPTQFIRSELDTRSRKSIIIIVCRAAFRGNGLKPRKADASFSAKNTLVLFFPIRGKRCFRKHKLGRERASRALCRCPRQGLCTSNRDKLQDHRGISTINITRLISTRLISSIRTIIAMSRYRQILRALNIAPTIEPTITPLRAILSSSTCISSNVGVNWSYYRTVTFCRGQNLPTASST